MYEEFLKLSAMARAAANRRDERGKRYRWIQRSAQARAKRQRRGHAVPAVARAGSVAYPILA
jgi:hypothetical protein